MDYRRFWRGGGKRNQKWGKECIRDTLWFGETTSCRPLMWCGRKTLGKNPSDEMMLLVSENSRGLTRAAAVLRLLRFTPQYTLLLETMSPTISLIFLLA